MEQLKTICSAFDTMWRKRSRILNTFIVIKSQIVNYTTKIGGYRGASKIISKTSSTALFNAAKKIPLSVYQMVANSVKPKNNLKNKVIAVDGSKVRLGPSWKKRGFFKRNNSKDHAHALISALYNCDDNVLIEMNLFDHSCERSALMTQISEDLKGSILVFDRGYFSTRLAEYLDSQGINFVFRIRKNIKNIKNFRRYVFGHEFHLATNLKDPGKRLRKIYKLRWKVETFFRTHVHGSCLEN